MKSLLDDSGYEDLSELERKIESSELYEHNADYASEFLIVADYIKDLYHFEEYLNEPKSIQKTFLYGSIIIAKSFLLYQLADKYFPQIRDYINNILY
ncbi:MAG: hypothetical protein ACOCRX_05210 [Candidatus Woesearchaeota archaeon]